MGSSADAVDWSAAGLGRLRSRVAGTLAANSVVWRVLPDGVGRALAAGTDLLLDGLLGALVAVSVTVRVADLRLLSVAFEVALYGYAAYSVVPMVLPDDPPAAAVLGTPRARIAASAFVLLVGFPVAASLPVLFSESALAILAAATGVALPAMVGDGAFVLAAVGGTLLAWVGIATYTYLAWWRHASVDDRVTFFVQTTPGTVDDEWRREARADLLTDGVGGTVRRAIAVLASTGLVPAALFFLGLLSALMVMLFPLPEAIVVAGAVVGALPGERRVPVRAVSLEDRLFAVFRYLTASRRGMFLVPFVVAGFAVAIVLTLVSNFGVVFLAYNVARQPEQVLRAAAASPLGVWGVLGVLVCAAAPGWYGLWFWVRATFRLPHHLQHWERTRPGGAEVQAMTDLPPRVTRPPGHLLAPSVMFVPLAGLLLASRAGPPSRVALVAFALAWPAATAVVLLAVYWTYTRDPQHPRTDGRALLGASFVQLGWLWLLGGGAIVPGYDGPFTLGVVLLVGAVSGTLYALDDLALYLEHVAGRNARAYVTFVGGLGEYHVAAVAVVLAAGVLGSAGVSLALGHAGLVLPLLLAAFAGLLFALGAVGWWLAASDADS